MTLKTSYTMIKLALFVGFLLLSSTLAIREAAAAPAPATPYVIYWGSWSTGQVTGIGAFPRTNPQNNVPRGVTQLNLSFANIVQNGANYQVVASDGFLTPGSNPYNVWAGFKYHNPEVKVLLAIGGASYPAIWNSTLTRQSAEAIATSIANAVNAKYPVASGSVTLDGVDLDVEGDAEGLTAIQAQNVALLIKSLRQKLPAKLITLTSFSTSADPLSCRTTWAADCSSTGSKHSGEIIPVLVEAGDKIDYVNNMAYDAGKNYNYKLSNANYRKYVPAHKLLLGLDLTHQWDSAGEYLESIAELKSRTEWARSNSSEVGGVFVWGIVGNAGQPSYPVNGPNGQLDIIGQLINENKPSTLPTQIEISAGSTYGTKAWITNGDAWYEFDYIAPTSSKVYNAQNSWNIGQLVNKTNLQVRVQLPNQQFLWCNNAGGSPSQASGTQKLDFNSDKKIKLQVTDQGGVYKLQCTFS